MKIILASGSPRRKQLMELAGIKCEILITNADETITGLPADQAVRLALRKANAAMEMAQDKTAVYIAADTIVSFENNVFGKPENPDDAFQMLSSMSGNKHTVYTGVAIKSAGFERSFVEATDVYFRKLSDKEIWDYIATGEPFDKAGSYGAQEKGSLLISRVEGDFYTVVGLPISKVWEVLLELGVVK